MTLKECTALLTPLALRFRAQMDDPSFRAYHGALKDVPARVFALAVEMAGKPPRRFFPSAPELLEIAEQARVQMRAQLAFQPCAMCSRTPGWNGLILNGVERLTRCECWKAHMSRVGELGVGDRPLALSAAEDQ